MKNLEKYRSLLNSEVQGLFLTSRYSRMYAAEFDIAEGFAIVSAKGARYYTDGRYIESAQNNIKDFEVIEFNAEHPLFTLLNQAIEDFGIKTFGFEDAYLAVGEFNSYRERLHADFVPMTAQINAFRASKEPWELDRMVKAQEITDKAHGVPGERKLQKGDFITMDFGVLYQGYCSDMTRTVALGYATDEMKKVYYTVLEAQLAGIAASKAGVSGQAVDAAARKVITDAGYGSYFTHSYGHSLGLEIHEAPNCNIRNTVPMPLHAVCSAEPGIYIPGKFGVRIEDVAIFDENGCRVITHSPKKELIIL